MQEAHDRLAKHGNGKFQAWVRSEFGMSDYTAERFMNVAKVFGDDLPHNVVNSPTILYELAAPKNADVREAVVQQIEAGEVKPSVKEQPPHPPGGCQYYCFPAPLLPAALSNTYAFRHLQKLRILVK